MTDQLPAQIADDPSPAPAALPEATNDSAGAPPVLAPDAVPVPPSTREAISARFKAARDEVPPGATPDVPLEDGYDIQVPPFIQRAQAEEAERVAAAKAEADALEAAQKAPPAEDDQRYTIKVMGQELSLTRAELIKQAGLDDEEAAELPMSTILKAARLTAAQEKYLAEARDLRNATKGSAAAPGGEPAAGSPPAGSEGAPADPDARAAGDPAPKPAQAADPKIVELSQRIQFGTPEEAAAALEEMTDYKLEKREREAKERAFADSIQTAVIDFTKQNVDILQDEPGREGERFDAFKFNSMAEIKRDLIALGATREEVDRTITTPEKAVEALHLARENGLKVREPTQILEAAAATVRKAFGLPGSPSAPPVPAPAPAATAAPNGIAAREALKRSLPQPPARASAPPAVTPPADPTPRGTSIVLGMRANRGQLRNVYPQK